MVACADDDDGFRDGDGSHDDERRGVNGCLTWKPDLVSVELETWRCSLSVIKFQCRRAFSGVD